MVTIPNLHGHEHDDSRDRKNVVVVEDNEVVMDLIKDVLNGEPDYKVLPVYDGTQAIQVIRSVETSLILLDVKLPGMNGFQIYDGLQADPKTAHIPVIFIPASHFDEEFRARGIKHPLFKPFNVDELLTRVGQVLRPSQSPEQS